MRRISAIFIAVCILTKGLASYFLERDFRNASHGGIFMISHGYNERLDGTAISDFP